MATSPQFASVPRSSSAVISTANTSRDGTGTSGTVFTAGASGSRIDEVTIKATATTTVGLVALYVSDGTNHRLYREVQIAAATPSTTVPSVEYVLTFDRLVLPTGFSLRASTQKAESFVVTANGGDF